MCLMMFNRILRGMDGMPIINNGRCQLFFWSRTAGVWA